MNIKVFPLLFIVKLKAFAFKVTHLHSVLFINVSYVTTIFIHVSKLELKLKRPPDIHLCIHVLMYVFYI